MMMRAHVRALRLRHQLLSPMAPTSLTARCLRLHGTRNSSNGSGSNGHSSHSPNLKSTADPTSHSSAVPGSHSPPNPVADPQAAQDTLATAARMPASRQAVDGVRTASNFDELRMRVTAFRMSNSRYGHASFVNAAVERMNELKAVGDLDLYNELLAVFPYENSYKTTRLLDAIWPRQSVHVDAALRCLDRMEDEGIIPDDTTYETVLLAFGRASLPLKKLRAMAYWLRRYHNANPFALPEKLPAEAAERVLLYLKRMAAHDVYRLGLDQIETDGAAAGYSQSEEQFQLLQQCCGPAGTQAHISVRGLYPVWMRGLHMSYAVMTVARLDTADRTPAEVEEADELVLSTALCLQADGSAAAAQSAAWQSAVQAWLADLEIRLPELARKPVAIHLNDVRLQASDEEGPFYTGEKMSSWT